MGRTCRNSCLVPSRVGTEQESSPNLLHQEPNQVDAPRPPPPAHVRYSDVLCGQAKSSIQQTDEPELASKPIMLLGNLTSILLTVVALLQALSWTIAGLLILATLRLRNPQTIWDYQSQDILVKEPKINRLQSPIKCRKGRNRNLFQNMSHQNLRHN